MFLKLTVTINGAFFRFRNGQIFALMLVNNQMTIFRPGSCTHSAKYRTITPFRYFGTLSYIDISLVEEFSYDERLTIFNLQNTQNCFSFMFHSCRFCIANCEILLRFYQWIKQFVAIRRSYFHQIQQQHEYCRKLPKKLHVLKC